MSRARLWVVVAGLLLGLVLPTLAQDSDPYKVVEGLYVRWYFRSSGPWQDSFGTQGFRFEPELFMLITDVASHEPGKGAVFDFDPWSGSKSPAAKVDVGQPSLSKDSATVPVTVRDTKGKSRNIKFVLAKVRGRWKITNLVYDDKRDLLKFVKH